MLKKILSVIIIFVLAFSFSAAGASAFYISGQSISVTDNNAVISGVIYNDRHEPAGGEVITIRIDNPDYNGSFGVSSQVSETVSGADGKFSYTYDFSADIKSGKYTVYLGGRNVTNRLESVFYYTNTADSGSLSGLNGAALLSSESLAKLGIPESLVLGNETEIAALLPANGNAEQIREAILFGGVITLLNKSTSFSADFKVNYGLLPIYNSQLQDIINDASLSSAFINKLDALRPFSEKQDFLNKIEQALLQTLDASKIISLNVTSNKGQTVKLSIEFEKSQLICGIDLEFKAGSGSMIGLTANSADKTSLTSKIPLSDSQTSIKSICDIYAKLNENADGVVSISYSGVVYMKTTGGTMPIKLSGGHTITINSEGGGNSGNGGGPTGGGNVGGGVIPNTGGNAGMGVGTTLPAPADSDPFSDINGFEWANESIKTLSARGVVNGFPDGSFKPGDIITRAQFAKLLVSAFSLEVKDGGAEFSDVSPEDWFYEVVTIAAGNGIVNGNEDGAFMPNSEISRQDMAVMVYRTANAVGLSLEKYTMPSDFSDMEQVSEYARESVIKVKQARIMNGMDDNMFVPMGVANRAMAAKVVFELMRFN